jgi:hypothetical protein
MDAVSPVIPGEDWKEVKIAEHQDEYATLPAIPLNHGGCLLSRWELSDEDIERIKETRSIWFYQWTMNQPMQPVSLTTEKPQLKALSNTDHRIR